MPHHPRCPGPSGPSCWAKSTEVSMDFSNPTVLLAFEASLATWMANPLSWGHSWWSHYIYIYTYMLHVLGFSSRWITWLFLSNLVCVCVCVCVCPPSRAVEEHHLVWGAQKAKTMTSTAANDTLQRLERRNAQKSACTYAQTLQHRRCAKLNKNYVSKST